MKASITTTTGRTYAGEIEHSVEGFTVLTGKPGRNPFIPHSRVQSIGWYKYQVTGERAQQRYLTLAREYHNLVQSGETHATVVMAARHRVTPVYMRNTLNRVRQAGLLTPGKMGGPSQSVLTDKAKALLIKGA